MTPPRHLPAPACALALILLLAGCSGGMPQPPARAAATDVEMNAIGLVETAGDFRRAIVGQTLRGNGTEVVIARGGALVGTRAGRPFAGTWEFTRGLFCHSMTGEVRRAEDRTCARAVLHRNRVHLAPVPTADR